MSTKKSTQETPAAATAPETPAPVTASEAAAPVMYVGPTLQMPFPLAKGAVFAGGLPAPLAKAVKADADLAALFLPLKTAGQALREIERNQGDLAQNLAKHAKAVAGKYAMTPGGRQPRSGAAGGQHNV